jgi:NAD(P)-dependent dehydrogenase (short-subunit alcohol dehydrogenase family)
MKLGSSTVVAITGASSGIGQELAFQLAARGCAVALGARRRDRIEANAEAIRKKGGRAIAVPTDVSVRGEVERFFRRAAEEFGRLDIAVHNAGISPAKGTLLENDEADVRRTFDVNVMGCVYGIWGAAPVMEKNGGGVMVFVSSIVGKRGVPLASAYCASKFAVQGLTESVRPELEKKNIRVVTVCPPGVDTEFFEANARRDTRRFRLHPVGRIARDIVRACEREPREVLLTMDAKLLRWMSALAPRFMDRAIARAKGV